MAHFSLAGSAPPHPGTFDLLCVCVWLCWRLLCGGGGGCSACRGGVALGRLCFCVFCRDTNSTFPVRSLFSQLLAALKRWATLKKKKKKRALKDVNPVRSKAATAEAALERVRRRQRRRRAKGCQVCSSVHAWLCLILEG